ncbi:MAG: trehalose-6-phosphate synthase [Gemmatimonadota bacterium]|jgi:trehalose 6-phosphate synthase
MKPVSDFVMVANRLPVSRDDERDRWVTSPGGLVSALVPILTEREGAWIGWTGAPDDAPSPFEHDGMRLIPVPLSAEDLDSYYLGFCNNTLWPLYHNAIRTPAYHRHWWRPYEAVNERFAEAVAETLSPRGIAWVHDYQLQLVPGRVRALRPDVTVGFFLHIPFPPVELFAYLPWREPVLRGLLGSDVIAFQTEQSVSNFRDAALRYAGARDAGEELEYDGRRVRLQWAPISVDTEAFAQAARSPEVIESARRLRERILPARKLVLGVDRLDYTKGIDHRLRAVQTFHERHPEAARDTVLLQLAVPSREELIQYAEQRERVERLVGQINGEHGDPGYTPVVYMYRHLGFEELVAAYLAADVMLVTPLADGMNLVAKEYIASRTSDDGLLVLSEFAGAAAELREAVLVNPLDLDGLAETLLYAVTITPEDAAERMRPLRATVREYDVYLWSRNCLEALES